MTPAQEKREYEKLRRAIYRWYRLGGSAERVIFITEWLYAYASKSAYTVPPNEPDEPT